MSPLCFGSTEQLWLEGTLKLTGLHALCHGLLPAQAAQCPSTASAPAAMGQLYGQC